LCRELGIEYPICSVGMGMAAGPELAAAVSGAGGLGVLGTHDLSAEAIQASITHTRQLTDRPFGVNVIIADDGSAEDRAVLVGAVGAAVAEGVAAVVLFWGDPAPYVPVAHAAGVKVLVQVGSVAEARAAAAAGVDGVIAQGSRRAAMFGVRPRSGSCCPRPWRRWVSCRCWPLGASATASGWRGRCGWGRRGVVGDAVCGQRGGLGPSGP
jgi:hypothetical protein